MRREYLSPAKFEVARQVAGEVAPFTDGVLRQQPELYGKCLEDLRARELISFGELRGATVG
eukprot:856172-Lingulodinium_polyedra.AAC.1